MELLPILVTFVVVVGVGLIIVKIADVRKTRIAASRSREQARIEAELERNQAELRATILRLASTIGAEAHEARKALIRESYLASRRTPAPQ
jgi:hypothetical protein